MRITAKNVRDAANLIERAPRLQQSDYQGWDYDDETHETTTDKPVCWCMMGAISYVKNPNLFPEELLTDDEGDVVNLGSAFNDAVFKAIRSPSRAEDCKSRSQSAHDRVAQFNDDARRTKGEAVKKLRRIAELMEQR